MNKFWNNIGRLFNNELTREQRDNIEKDINSLNSDSADLKELHQIWDKAGKIYDDYKPNKQKAWDIINSKTDDGLAQKSALTISLFFKIAAIFILLIGISSILYFTINKSPNQFNTVYAETKTLNELVLKDGTKIWLNNNTTLKYPKRFSRNIREVILEGEAFFEVEKDPDKPFIIKTNQTLTTVLGTSFNIRAYPNENKTTVSVATGKVQMNPNKSLNQSIILTKGETGIYEQTIDSIYTNRLNNINSFAWKTDNLLFDNMLLTEVCEILSNYFSQKIIIADPKLEKLTFTASFKNQKLNDVLNVIDFTLNIEHEFKEEAILLKEKRN